MMSSTGFLHLPEKSNARALLLTFLSLFMSTPASANTRFPRAVPSECVICMHTKVSLGMKKAQGQHTDTVQLAGQIGRGCERDE